MLLALMNGTLRGGRQVFQISPLSAVALRQALSTSAVALQKKMDDPYTTARTPVEASPVKRRISYTPSQAVDQAVRREVDGATLVDDLALVPYKPPSNLYDVSNRDPQNNFLFLGPDTPQEIPIFSRGVRALGEMLRGIIGASHTVVSSAGEDVVTNVSASGTPEATVRSESLYTLDARGDEQYDHTHGGLRTLMIPVEGGNDCNNMPTARVEGVGGDEEALPIVEHVFKVPGIVLAHLGEETVHGFNNVTALSMHHNDVEELETAREKLVDLVLANHSEYPHVRQLVCYIRSVGVNHFNFTEKDRGTLSRVLDNPALFPGVDLHGCNDVDELLHRCSEVDFRQVDDKKLRLLLKRVFVLGAHKVNVTDPHVIGLLTTLVPSSKQLDVTRTEHDFRGYNADIAEAIQCMQDSELRKKSYMPSLTDLQNLRASGVPWSSNLGGERVGLSVKELEEVRAEYAILVDRFVRLYEKSGQSTGLGTLSTEPDSGISDSQFASVARALDHGAYGGAFTFTLYSSEGIPAFKDCAADAFEFCRFIADSRFGGRKCTHVLTPSEDSKDGRDTSIFWVNRTECRVPSYEVYRDSYLAVYITGNEPGVSYIGKVDEEGRGKVVPTIIPPRSVAIMHIPANAIHAATGVVGQRYMSGTRERVQQLNSEREGHQISVRDPDLYIHLRNKMKLVDVDTILPPDKAIDPRTLIALLKGLRVAQLDIASRVQGALDARETVSSSVGHNSAEGDRDSVLHTKEYSPGKV